MDLKESNRPEVLKSSDRFKELYNEAGIGAKVIEFTLIEDKAIYPKNSECLFDKNAEKLKSHIYTEVVTKEH